MFGKLKLIGVGGVAIALLGMAVGIQILRAQNADLNRDLGSVNEALEQAIANADANLAAFDRANALLQICVDERAVDEQANRDVVARLEDDLERVTAERQRIRVVREEIFRDPTCDELGSIDIAAQCPAWAGSLRERSTAFD